MLELKGAFIAIVLGLMARFEGQNRFSPSRGTEDDYLHAAAESALETLRKGHVRLAEGILSNALREYRARRG
ncbi:hypothetical protein Snov_1687 [Ancylobacter novellus DSM 506]|uniref:Uncharacterized protein n=1 Tax=Ancylobacter novellus (strain ATCC 8093 / DSM 506 / JCM 20403 / CCM 1077 / IAM 12100 / NBRC 12443 / NCIMB 10456) TaxID=639283 RepID=D7AAI9_ANCN5|nr:hypothetical protein [Ancylobacter novellus]ADH88992.1 hypothetical protein Snov_1687 [Ancylobacter novellus DSM 506]